MHGATVKIIR